MAFKFRRDVFLQALENLAGSIDGLSSRALENNKNLTDVTREMLTGYANASFWMRSRKRYWLLQRYKNFLHKIRDEGHGKALTHRCLRSFSEIRETLPRTV